MDCRSAPPAWGRGGLGRRTGADSSTMELWSILEKSRMSPRMVSSVSPLSRIVSLSSLRSSDKELGPLHSFWTWNSILEQFPFARQGMETSVVTPDLFPASSYC